MIEAKLLRKKLKNGLIVDKWDLVTIIEKQQAEIEALKTENSHLKYEISSGAWNSRELTDQEIFNIYAYQQDTYAGDNFPVAVARAILRKAQEK
jgi:predicted RNase H-like nuclease (RuvC/YqgF family)